MASPSLLSSDSFCESSSDDLRDSFRNFPVERRLLSLSTDHSKERSDVSEMFNPKLGVSREYSLG